LLERSRIARWLYERLRIKQLSLVLFKWAQGLKRRR
jgi:hypothetical protein